MPRKGRQGGGAAGAGTWGQRCSGTFRSIRGTWTRPENAAPSTDGGNQVGCGRCSGWRAWMACVDGVIRRERQRSVERVGAGAGSSAGSWGLLRGGVVRQRSLRVPMTSPSVRRIESARAGAVADTALHPWQWIFIKPWNSPIRAGCQNASGPAPAGLPHSGGPGQWWVSRSVSNTWRMSLAPVP
jgi:hypothetical protein